MTPTERAVRDALEGGYGEGSYWRNTNYEIYAGGISYDTDPTGYIDNEAMLLDPAFWKAIGVTRGYYPKEITLGENWDMTIWLEKWHSFIDYLANGKTIDDALKSIEV